MANLKLHLTLMDNLHSTLVQDLTSFLDDGLVLNALPTQLRLDVLTEHLVFRGQGLAYVYDGLMLSGVSAGTITGIDYYDLLNLKLSVTGLDVNAPALLSALLDNQWDIANGLLWGGDDLMQLSRNDDEMRGYDGNDTIYGYKGDDTLSGDGGMDRLYGGSGQDRLYGGKAADLLQGDSGNDILNGGKGSDRLFGGTGRDQLTGAAGADVFAFAQATAGHHDLITDFHHGEDQIQLDRSAFAGFGYTGRLRDADFVLGRMAADGADRLIYQESSGRLWYDADGNGAGAKVLIAELGAGTDLAASDVLIV